MLPDIPYKNGATRIPVQQFAGLERRIGAGNGTIKDMWNLTGRDMPVLSSRPKRWKMMDVTAPHGLFSTGGDVLFVDGAKLYQNGQQKLSGLPGGSSADRVFAAMGTRLLLWPDKIVTEIGSTSYTALAASVTQSCTFQDGQYAGESAAGNEIRAANTSYNWGTLFKVGDAVTISGAADAENNITAIVREINGYKLRFYPNTFKKNTTARSITVARTVPDLDYICVNDNRVWGCKGDTICCCKLGDPTNWNVFDGLSTDSWSVETGTLGSFTGCISFMGYPVFFKEDRVFKVYGNRPSNFEVISSATLGVLAGASRSMAVAGETLYYLSRAGFVRYNGGYPSVIDEALNAKYLAANAGSDGRKYYACAYRSDDEVELLVFDPDTGQWHKEDDLYVHSFGIYWGYLCCLTGDALVGLADYPGAEGEGFQVEDDFDTGVWFAEFDLQTFGSKYPVRLWLRMENANEATVKITYNGGELETVTAIPAATKKTSYIPVPIRRCDRFGVAIETTGAWKLYAMEIETRAERTNRKGG